VLYEVPELLCWRAHLLLAGSISLQAVLYRLLSLAACIYTGQPSTDLVPAAATTTACCCCCCLLLPCFLRQLLCWLEAQGPAGEPQPAQGRGGSNRLEEGGRWHRACWEKFVGKGGGVLEHRRCCCCCWEGHAAACAGGCASRDAAGPSVNALPDNRLQQQQQLVQGWLLMGPGENQAMLSCYCLQYSTDQSMCCALPITAVRTSLRSAALLLQASPPARLVTVCCAWLTPSWPQRHARSSSHHRWGRAEGTAHSALQAAVMIKTVVVLLQQPYCSSLLGTATVVLPCTL
jgi:hypothetical protein